MLGKLLGKVKENFLVKFLNQIIKVRLFWLTFCQKINLKVLIDLQAGRQNLDN